GIPALLFDRNFGYKDINYHPHYVIRGGRAERVCSQESLMTHARVTIDGVEGFPLGASVTDCHIEVLHRVMPQAVFQTQSEYLRCNQDLAAAVLEIVANKQPQLWYRRVLEDGTIRKEPRGAVPSSKQILGNLYGFSNMQAGWLVPNTVTILLDAVVEQKRSGCPQLHHIGGQDMASYVMELGESLSQLYSTVARQLGLSECVEYNVHSAAPMRFVVRRHRREALDCLFESARAFATNERNRGRSFKFTPQEQWSTLAADLQPTKDWYFDQVRDAVAACPEVFYALGDRNFFNQHDLVGDDDLYVHPEAATLPLKIIGELWDILRHCARSKKMREQRRHE
ncbi:MAG: hypothetical protein Q7S26_01330, partial [bacterium]|nr:hypothetical protein [bacterium]